MHILPICDFWMQLKGETGKREAELVGIIMLISGLCSCYGSKAAVVLLQLRGLTRLCSFAQMCFLLLSVIFT